jgi:hypothetical protein
LVLLSVFSFSSFCKSKMWCFCSYFHPVVLWQFPHFTLVFKIPFRHFVCFEKIIKVIPQFYIAHFYCAHLITYNFIHYTYRLKKNYHFMTILCYFKTSLVTFVQIITLKSMFSKKACKSVARVPCVCSIFIYLYFTF